MDPALQNIHGIPEFSSNWNLDNIDTSNLPATVSPIHLCALRNDLNEGDEAGESPTNHWTMCLQLSPQSSVMLDMAPGYGSDGLRGKVEASSIGEPYTEETRRTFSFKPTKEITVGDVIRLVAERGRDAFSFSPEWEGCRFWMSTVMGDFEDAGLVEEGSAKTAKEALLKYWVNPEGSEPRVMREGTSRR